MKQEGAGVWQLECGGETRSTPHSRSLVAREVQYRVVVDAFFDQAMVVVVAVVVAEAVVVVVEAVVVVVIDKFW